MSADITLNSSAGSFPPAGHYSHSTTAGGFVFILGNCRSLSTARKKRMPLLKIKPGWCYRILMLVWQVLEFPASIWCQFAYM